MAATTPSLQRVLSFGTFCCAIGCCAANITNFVSSLRDQLTHGLQLPFLLLSFDILLLAGLLMYGALVRSPGFLHLFGFLQYTSGTGFLLALIGSLVIGMAGNLGLYSGVGSIVWGIVSCGVHCATKKTQPATNEPLLPP
jgi:hypothetical protein